MMIIFQLLMSYGQMEKESTQQITKYEARYSVQQWSQLMNIISSLQGLTSLREIPYMCSMLGLVLDCIGIQMKCYVSQMLFLNSGPTRLVSFPQDSNKEQWHQGYAIDCGVTTQTIVGSCSWQRQGWYSRYQN